MCGLMFENSAIAAMTGFKNACEEFALTGTVEQMQALIGHVPKGAGSKLPDNASEALDHARGAAARLVCSQFPNADLQVAIGLYDSLNRFDGHGDEIEKGEKAVVQTVGIANTLNISMSKVHKFKNADTGKYGADVLTRNMSKIKQMQRDCQGHSEAKLLTTATAQFLVDVMPTCRTMLDVALDTIEEVAKVLIQQVVDDYTVILEKLEADKGGVKGGLSWTVGLKANPSWSEYSKHAAQTVRKYDAASNLDTTIGSANEALSLYYSRQYLRIIRNIIAISIIMIDRRRQRHNNPYRHHQRRRQQPKRNNERGFVNPALFMHSETQTMACPDIDPIPKKLKLNTNSTSLQFHPQLDGANPADRRFLDNRYFG